jgi:SAM-dependent methyltransferase
VYDAAFSGWALSAAPGVLRILRRHGIADGLIVDMGCGNGILARQLTFAGYDAVGIDQSAAMIRMACERAPRARFVRSTMQDARIPACSAVVSVGMSFSFAFATDRRGTEALRFFRKARKALLPGGLVAFDFAVDGRKPGGMPKHGRWFGHGWSLEVEGERDGDLIRRTVTAVQGNTRSVETHLLRVYDPSSLHALLKTAGFDPQPLKGFGDLRFGSGHAGVLALCPDGTTGR